VLNTARIILQAVDDIERVFDEHSFAEPNDAAVNSLQEIATRLGQQHPVAGRHAQQIHRLSTVFYGERRRQQRGGGAAALYAAMRISLLGQIQHVAQALAEAGSVENGHQTIGRARD